MIKEKYYCFIAVMSYKREMSDNLLKIKQLIKDGFLHILTGSFLGRAITMVSSIVVARLVDKTEYAYVSYADNLYTYIGLVAGLGLASALLKFCASNNSSGRDISFVKLSFLWGGSTQFLVSLLMCIVITFVDIPFPQARKYIWALLLYQPLYFLYDTLACYVRTRRENKRYANAGIIMSACLCIFSIVLLLIVGTMGLIYARYIAVIAVFIYLGVFVYRYFAGIEAVPIDQTEKKSFLAMGLSLMAARMFSEMMPANETFLVNQLIKDEIVTANFRIAGVFPQLLQLVASSVNIYFFPVVAQMTDWREIKKKLISIGTFNFGFVLFAAIVGAVLNPFAIKLLYGQKYVDAIPMTYMLWAMKAMNGCVRMFPMNMLPALGRTKFNLCMAAGSCVVQTFLDYFFIKKLGVYGIAIGTTLVYALSGIAYWWYLMKVCREEQSKQKNDLA